jgi:hypothetical protein
VNTIQIPEPVPAAVIRPRTLIEAVAAQSLREQGTGSRTARAWRWVLTGHGPSPVSDRPGPGRPPDLDEIRPEAGVDTEPPECAWPPWRYAFDPDPDRQQARRVLRWLTGDADAIPLLDPRRGWYEDARFHFARSDEEIRTIRGWARHGLHEHGDLPDYIPPWQAERPWQWPAAWMNAAWLRGAIAYFDWVLGDQDTAPLSGLHKPLDPVRTLAEPDPPYAPQELIALRGVGHGVANIEEEMMVYLAGVTMQGHEGQPAAEPSQYPPPQWGEGVEQAHDWVTGENLKPPADHHGCGGYHPCPGQRRCSCEAAGYCLRGQCPACGDSVCNAARTAIEESY